MGFQALLCFLVFCQPVEENGELRCSANFVPLVRITWMMIEIMTVSDDQAVVHDLLEKIVDAVLVVVDPAVEQQGVEKRKNTGPLPGKVDLIGKVPGLKPLNTYLICCILVHCSFFVIVLIYRFSHVIFIICNIYLS